MIICVSIVDKHGEPGKLHRGTWLFEVPIPNDSHWDLVAIAAPAATENELRPLLGRLLQKEDMDNPFHLDGSRA